MNKISISTMNIKHYAVHHGIGHLSQQFDKMVAWCEIAFGEHGNTWRINNGNTVTFAHKDDAVIFELT